MKQDTIIQWNQAQQKAEEIRRKTEKHQAKMLADYMESNHELFDIRDFEFYATETGKSLSWILEHRNNHTNPAYKYFGAELDESDLAIADNFFNNPYCTSINFLNL